MVDFRPDARSVLIAIWEAGANGHRDAEGGDVVAKLTDTAAALDDRTLYDLMFELKDGGWITFDADGSAFRRGDDPDQTDRSRATGSLVDWPRLVARRSSRRRSSCSPISSRRAGRLPRHEQQWHLGGEEAPTSCGGPWGERQVLVSDVLALANLEFLDAVNLNYVYGDDYVISPRGRAYYAAMKRREAQPLERQEAGSAVSSIAMTSRPLSSGVRQVGRGRADRRGRRSQTASCRRSATRFAKPHMSSRLPSWRSTTRRTSTRPDEGEESHRVGHRASSPGFGKNESRLSRRSSCATGTRPLISSSVRSTRAISNGETRAESSSTRHL